MEASQGYGTMTTVIWDGIHVCRKPRTCDQCMRLIKSGQRYRRQTYEDGGLQTYRAHEDCDEAAAYYADIAGIRPFWGEECLQEIVTVDDYGWLLQKFPHVADRFNVQGPIRLDKPPAEA